MKSMKEVLRIPALVAVCLLFSLQAAAQKRTPVKAGALISPADSLEGSGRVLSQRLFISRGELGTGMQFSYLGFSSQDSELMMLLQNLDAYGRTFSVSPVFSYAVRDNKAVGMKLKYSKTDAGVSEADMSLLSDDLSMKVENIQAHSNSIQTSVFYRSYIGLDSKGRFGLFSDISLSYSHSRTSFSYDTESLGSHTLGNRLKLGIHPGLEVFVMNNVSTHFSIGIGGVSYTNSKYFKDNVFVGRRNVSGAKFLLDISDISMGLTIHI